MSSNVTRLAAVLCVGVASAVAFAGPPPGMRWSDFAFPGQNMGSDRSPVPRPAHDAPPVYPAQTAITVRILPYQNSDPSAVANVLAHLPPGSDLWVGDTKMVSMANKASYELVSPALEKGKDYVYHTRVMWLEGDKWVTQHHAFNIRAGDVHCLEIMPIDPPQMERDVAATTAKLPSADKEAIKAQKFCAVQDTIRLGSMGTPVKINVNGKDVFLCCEGCRAKALKDPEKTLKTVEANKTKPVKAEPTK